MCRHPPPKTLSNLSPFFFFICIYFVTRVIINYVNSRIIISSLRLCTGSICHPEDHTSCSDSPHTCLYSEVFFCCFFCPLFIFFTVFVFFKIILRKWIKCTYSVGVKLINFRRRTLTSWQCSTADDDIFGQLTRVINLGTRLVSEIVYSIVIVFEIEKLGEIWKCKDCQMNDRSKTVLSEL